MAPSVWRPRMYPAEDYPLAVLDPHSVPPDNVPLAVDFVSPLHLSELAYYKYDPTHRWFWMSNQTPDEVVIFTQWDTHPPGDKFNSTFLPPFSFPPYNAQEES